MIQEKSNPHQVGSNYNDDEQIAPEISFRKNKKKREYFDPRKESSFLTEKINNLMKDKKEGNDLKFIIDQVQPHLVKHFRMLGIDTDYDSTYSANYILYKASKENRIVITRSSKIIRKMKDMEIKLQRRLEKVEPLKQKIQNACGDTLEAYKEELEDLEDEIKDVKSSMPYIYYVQSVGRYKQLKEAVNQFRIVFVRDVIFSRCAKCNGMVQMLNSKEEVKDKVKSNTYRENDFFAMCEDCKHIYWGTIDGNKRQQRTFLLAIHFCQTYSYPCTTEQKGKTIQDEEFLDHLRKLYLPSSSMNDQTNLDAKKKQNSSKEDIPPINEELSSGTSKK